MGKAMDTGFANLPASSYDKFKLDLGVTYKYGDWVAEPWLHIAEVVAREATARGFKRIALTGTQWLVESDVYPDKLRAHGLECVRPSEAERRECNRIIMDELVRGVFKPEAVAYFQQVIERLKREGCDAVVLGCTEIPLIISDANCALPTLDSTRLLARAALKRAVQSA